MWTKGITIGLSLAVVASVGAVLFSSHSSGEENQARLISRQLLHVTPGVHRGVIPLHIGDMLQIEPFDLPITKGLQERIHEFRKLEEAAEPVATAR